MTVVACIECCSTGVCVCQVGRVLGDDPAEPDPPGGRQWTHSGPHPPLGHVQPHEWTGESPVMTGKKKKSDSKVKGQEEQAIVGGGAAEPSVQLGFKPQTSVQL